MENVEKVYYIQSATFGFLAKNSVVGTVILQKTFWNYINEVVSSGVNIRIETLRCGRGNVGPSFLFIWASQKKFEVTSKPRAGVDYQYAL